MKYIKFIGINIVVFAILFFLLSLLFPNVINNNKTITVQVNKEKIFNAVLALNNWNQWNVFSKTANVSITLQYAGKDTIATIWKQENGRTLLSVHNFIAVNNDATAINWLLQEKLKWYQPLKKFAALFTGKKTGIAMETSLDNFKKQLESAQPNPGN